MGHYLQLRHLYLLQPPGSTWDGKTKFKFVCTERDLTAIANTTNINMPVLKNVISCELMGYFIPNPFYTDIYSTGVANGANMTPDFLILEVEEFYNYIHSSNPAFDNSFAILATWNDTDDSMCRKKPQPGFDYYRKIRYFNPPIASLESLTLKIKTDKNAFSSPGTPVSGYAPVGTGGNSNNKANYTFFKGDEGIFTGISDATITNGYPPNFTQSKTATPTLSDEKRAALATDMQFIFEFTCAPQNVQV